MAVVNEYMLSTVVKTQVKGGNVVAIAGNFEVAAADDAGSKYRICRVGANWVPISMVLNSDAIADATAVDFGIYDTLEQGGAVKDDDIFLAAEDINGGHALSSEQNLMEDLAIEKIGKQIYELAGDSAPTPNGEYDLVLTADSNISAAGTIAVRLLFAVA
jgi:hypothetical protein